MLLADLREEIGDNSFFTLLKTYTREFRDGNATTEDFIRLAEEISGQDLDEFFRSGSSSRSPADAHEAGLPASTHSAMVGANGIARLAHSAVNTIPPS